MGRLVLPDLLDRLALMGRLELPDLPGRRVLPGRLVMTVPMALPGLLDQLRAENALDHVEVTGLNLEELFKDFVKGRRAPT